MLIAVPSICLANAAIPGPLMHFGAMNTGVGIWWLVLSIFTCTLLEGIIFHVARVFKRPYVCSLALNGLSLIAGVPLAFVGAALGDFMIIATALSIVTEVAAGVAWRSQRKLNGGTSSARRTVLSVLGGNVLSNVVLILLLVWMSHLYPPRWVYERECMQNIRALQKAELEYQMATNPTNGAPIIQEALLPYLPDNEWPVCPFKGIYHIGAVGQEPTCTHRPGDKPIRNRREPNKMPGLVP